MTFEQRAAEQTDKLRKLNGVASMTAGALGAEFYSELYAAGSWQRALKIRINGKTIIAKPNMPEAALIKKIHAFACP